MGFQGFQAAHVVPCDFSINGVDGVYTLFRSPIIRGNVKLKVFGQTKIVHKLANYADRRCEAIGWINALHQSARRVLDGANPDEIYRVHLVPQYILSVREARQKLLDGLSQVEMSLIGKSPIFGANGQPTTRRPQDFRVGKSVTDSEVLSINKTVVLQIFDEYERGDAGLAPIEFFAARRQAEGYIDLELDWRRKQAQK